MSKRKRDIAVVTGSRAEYGLLEPVLEAVARHAGLNLQLIVSGAHLVSGTWRDVRWPIAARVAMQRRGRVGRGEDVEAIGRGVAGFGRVFAEMEPDVVVVLGDRIEPLAAAVAASVGGFCVAHIHGGDRAEGVADESMRHAISKLAHLHFAATVASRSRLIRMGEDPRRVFHVGSPAVDGLAAVRPATDAPAAIVLQHPIGSSDEEERRGMAATLEATRGLDPLVMAPNSDAGSRGIRAAIGAAGVTPIEHLRREEWLSTLAGCEVIVGNSSAGLIEAAALGVRCVNIGPRQAGRERAGNVVDCDYGVHAVRAALVRALRNRVTRKHPYGTGRAGEKIAAILGRIALERVTLRKRNAY